MPDTISNNRGNLEDHRPANSPSRRSTRNVPNRRGSKYADILLQQLQKTLFDETESAIVGLVGSAPRQGATTMAINLAIRAADHDYSPALIIDSNFKNRKITRLYRCTGTGLGECLNGNAAIENCVGKTNVPNLSALGAGKNNLAKQILVDQSTANEFFKMVRNEYQFSVVDLPGMNEPSFADSILPHLDGVLIVARYGVRKERMLKLQDSVRDSGGNVLGVVMIGNDNALPSWVPNFLS